MRMFVSGILLVNKLESNVKKLKKHNIEKKNKLGKFVFHEAKKVNSLRFVTIMNHFTTVVGNVLNILFVGFL